MREFIIPAEHKAEPAPAAAPVVVLPESPEPSLRHRPRAPVRQKDFIIQYEGKFIGHFRALRPVTPRIAFGQVARELRAQRPDFSPAKLALFRPAKLRLKSPSRAVEAAAGGDFVWFAGK